MNVTVGRRAAALFRGMSTRPISSTVRVTSVSRCFVTVTRSRRRALGVRSPLTGVGPRQRRVGLVSARAHHGRLRLRPTHARIPRRCLCRAGQIATRPSSRNSSWEEKITRRGLFGEAFSMAPTISAFSGSTTKGRERKDASQYHPKNRTRQPTGTARTSYSRRVRRVARS